MVLPMVPVLVLAMTRPPPERIGLTTMPQSTPPRPRHGAPMHYAEIAQAIIDSGYRINVGLLPAATVAATQTVDT